MKPFLLTVGTVQFMAGILASGMGIAPWLCWLAIISGSCFLVAGLEKK